MDQYYIEGNFCERLGGFKKNRGQKYADIMHTFYGLAALSKIKEFGLISINPLLAIPVNDYARYLSKSHKIWKFFCKNSGMNYFSLSLLLYSERDLNEWKAHIRQG